jgi:hypothetical protein
MRLENISQLVSDPQCMSEEICSSRLSGTVAGALIFQEIDNRIDRIRSAIMRRVSGIFARVNHYGTRDGRERPP